MGALYVRRAQTRTSSRDGKTVKGGLNGLGMAADRCPPGEEDKLWVTRTQHTVYAIGPDGKQMYEIDFYCVRSCCQDGVSLADVVSLLFVQTPHSWNVSFGQHTLNVDKGSANAAATVEDGPGSSSLPGDDSRPVKIFATVDGHVRVEWDGVASPTVLLGAPMAGTAWILWDKPVTTAGSPASIRVPPSTSRVQRYPVKFVALGQVTGSDGGHARAVNLLDHQQANAYFSASSSSSSSAESTTGTNRMGR